MANLRRIEFQIGVFRFQGISQDAKEWFDKVLPEFASTFYKKQALLEEAPEKCDCLTSIHFIFKKAFGFDLPLTFVGDMPRTLASSGWSFQLIDSSQVRSGDLLFLKRKDQTRLIIHTALVVKVDTIFHCRRDVGAVVESVDSVFQIYEQKLLERQVHYIDYRNVVLREKNGGCFIDGDD